MTSSMRRTVRGAAAGMGALAIIAGTAACGDLLGGGDEEGDGGTGTEETQEEGGESEEGADDSTESEDTETTETTEDTEDSEAAEDTGTDEGETAEDGDDAAGEALTDEDLTAVGDVFYEFMQATVAGDGTAACGLVTNPNTGEVFTGAELDACAETFAATTESEGMDPAMADALDRSMIEGVDNGDGTASVTMAGQDSGLTYIKAGDGNWYIDGSGVI
ncbi:hypothetical protein [Brachybacterium sp.]|uniref:hypothetical protein n=1 Tax=Brachybacterium sp. TaxID=1891286 RepID=UPI003F90DFA4